jgi:quercetin dioxygenase-like cupin family protein
MERRSDMKSRRQVYSAALAGCLLLAPLADAQEPGGKPVGRNIGEMKFVPVPGPPTCAPGSVQSGDPTRGPSVILGKLGAGCVVPWHWHTPNEYLMIVSGVVRLEVKDGKPLTLRAGAFALMPSRHVHQARCPAACVLYVHSDTAFDIHYVDPQGNEIPPDDALKAVKETAAKATQ